MTITTVITHKNTWTKITVKFGYLLPNHYKHVRFFQANNYNLNVTSVLMTNHHKTKTNKKSVIGNLLFM